MELSSLQSLSFHSCKRLISLWDNGNVGHLTSLRSLFIYDCPELTSLPNSIKYLQKLQIKNCEELDFDKGEGLEGLQSLRLLYISNLKLTRLPNDIQSAAASLQHLSVENCLGLVELPYWLHRFASLRTIEIIYCRNLLSLPKTISHLISLQELKIKGCPHLSKRCGVPGGEDYSLVQHVPKFELDEVCFLTK